MIHRLSLPFWIMHVKVRMCVWWELILTFIMLLYFWNNLLGRIVIKFESKRKHKATECDVGKMVESLGVIQKYLTFAHAFGGSNTTSAKLSILKLLE